MHCPDMETGGLLIVLSIPGVHDERFVLCYVRVEDSIRLGEELRWADAVVLTYACDQPATLKQLSSFWLPELRRLEVSSIESFKYFSTSSTTDFLLL